MELTGIRGSFRYLGSFRLRLHFPLIIGFQIGARQIADWLIVPIKWHQFENHPKKTFSFQLSKFFLEFGFDIRVQFFPYFPKLFPRIVSELIDNIGIISDIRILSKR